MACKEVNLGPCFGVDDEGKPGVKVDGETVKCVDDGEGRSFLEANFECPTADPAGGIELGPNGWRLKIDDACNDCNISTSTAGVKVPGYRATETRISKQHVYLNDMPEDVPSEPPGIDLPDLGQAIGMTYPPECCGKAIVFAIVDFGNIDYSFAADNEPRITDFSGLLVNGTPVSASDSTSTTTWNFDSRGPGGDYYQGSESSATHYYVHCIEPGDELRLYAGGAFIKDGPAPGAVINNSPAPNLILHHENKLMMTILR